MTVHLRPFLDTSIIRTNIGSLIDRGMILRSFVHDAYVINVVRVHCCSSIVNHFQFLDHSGLFLYNYHVFDRFLSHSHQPGQRIPCPYCITNPALERVKTYTFMRHSPLLASISYVIDATYRCILTRSSSLFTDCYIVCPSLE